MEDQNLHTNVYIMCEGPQREWKDMRSRGRCISLSNAHKHQILS